jgi:hypothetical protein
MRRRNDGDKLALYYMNNDFSLLRASVTWQSAHMDTVYRQSLFRIDVLLLLSNIIFSIPLSV